MNVIKVGVKQHFKNGQTDVTVKSLLISAAIHECKAFEDGIPTSRLYLKQIGHFGIIPMEKWFLHIILAFYIEYFVHEIVIP